MIVRKASLPFVAVLASSVDRSILSLPRTKSLMTSQVVLVSPLRDGCDWVDSGCGCRQRVLVAHNTPNDPVQSRLAKLHQ
ncbi:hypothetical protein D3C85_1476310 [compost metagenome]